MSNKKNNDFPEQTDDVLDFEDAKEMTVEEAAKKQEEIKAGITKDDNLLDRYIKQHREEIEADKFETKQLHQLTKEVSSSQKSHQDDLEETKLTLEKIPEPLAAKESATKEVTPQESQQTTSYDDFDDDFDDDDGSGWISFKWLGIIGFVIFIGVAWAIYMNYNNASTDSTASSSSKASTSSSTSTTESSALKEFNNLYASFFTDEEQTTLKNASFDQLEALETALKALEGTDDYEAAKEKYDQLKAAIEATEAVNSQFDKPAVVDGEVDTTATVNSEASFTSPSTGLSSVDADLTAAINFGRSQLDGTAAATTETPAQSSSASANASSSSEASSPAQSTNTVTLTNGIVLNYAARIVYGSDKVNLQRDLSRVPYSDQAIADVNNSAWQFASGVLEKIIATSNQRGYFSGNDFILEKVNIINGRAYYNLFRTDGTYLFSINAQTGYFVGNASGNSDALDF